MLATLAALAALLAQQPSTDPPVDSAALRAALQVELDAFVEGGRVAGATAGVAWVDGPALELAAGVRDPAGLEPVEPRDRMLAGSTGKTFVAALALELASEGALDLDAPVAESLGTEAWFDRLPNARQLTLRHLLSHRSGLERYEFKSDFARDLRADPERVWQPRELLQYVLDDEPLFAPGADFAYSDTNYILAGILIERAAGEALLGAIERRWIAPLELGGIAPATSRRVPGLIQGHAGPRDPLGLPQRVLDAAGRFCINPQFEWAGGGLAATGGDLARWARALYGGDVLGEASREAMLAAQAAPELGPGTGYGLGAIVWTTDHGPAWGHSGFFPGYLTEMRFWPERGLAVAVQVNTSDARALPRSLSALCQDLLETAHAARPR